MSNQEKHSSASSSSSSSSSLEVVPKHTREKIKLRMLDDPEEAIDSNGKRKNERSKSRHGKKQKRKGKADGEVPVLPLEEMAKSLCEGLEFEVYYKTSKQNLTKIFEKVVERQRNGKGSVVLTPVRPHKHYWSQYVMPHADKFLTFDNRIPFGEKDAYSTTPYSLVAFYPREGVPPEPNFLNDGQADHILTYVNALATLAEKNTDEIKEWHEKKADFLASGDPVARALISLVRRAGRNRNPQLRLAPNSCPIGSLMGKLLETYRDQPIETGKDDSEQHRAFNKFMGDTAAFQNRLATFYAAWKQYISSSSMKACRESHKIYLDCGYSGHVLYL